MQNISFILYLFAAVCLYAGLHHLVFFLRRPGAWTQLLFSALCVTHTSYFIVQGLWYSSTTAEQALPLVQYAYSIISLILAIQLWFFYLYCDKSFHVRWCVLGTIIFGAFSITMLFPSPLFLSMESAHLKTFTFLNLVDLQAYEFLPGTLGDAFLLCMFLEMMFLLFVVCRYYLKRFSTLLMPMPCAWAVVVLCGLYDALSATGLTTTIYLSEFAYLLLILAMAYRLTNDFINAMDEVERLNTHLDEIVMQRTRELEDKNMELEVLSTTDQLTGLYNRRHAEQTLQRTLNQCERYGTPMSIILADIDHFKSVNDTYGHDVGDKVLIKVSLAIEKTIRNTDTAARWGGEEFLILVPETETELCSTLAERLRENIQNGNHDHGSTVTASFGIASHQPGDTLSALIKRADAALYTAKGNGRNCVVAA